MTPSAPIPTAMMLRAHAARVKTGASNQASAPSPAAAHSATTLDETPLSATLAHSSWCTARCGSSDDDARVADRARHRQRVRADAPTSIAPSPGASSDEERAGRAPTPRCAITSAKILSRASYAITSSPKTRTRVVDVGLSAICALACSASSSIGLGIMVGTVRLRS